MSLMETLKKSDPEIAAQLDRELNRQRTKLELIASENIVSKAVLEAQGVPQHVSLILAGRDHLPALGQQLRRDAVVQE